VFAPERRRSPRVPVDGHARVPAELRDVSLGGFSLETPAELTPGLIQDFWLRTPDGTEMVLRARVVYSRREHRPEGGDVCVTGAAFLEDITRPVLSRYRRSVAS
jgi:hypothetical protein